MLARGFYEVAAPFTLKPGMIYTNEAIRSFPDFLKMGIDPYTTFYTPVGLENGSSVDGIIFQYRDEVAVQANIITLLGSDGVPVYVPDTYILSYPNMPNQPYSTIILSMSIGPVPDTMNLNSLKASIANLVHQAVGVTTVVNENRAPTPDQPSNDEANSLESARTAAITLIETDLSQKLEQYAQANLSKGVSSTLTSILKDKGLLPH